MEVEEIHFIQLNDYRLDKVIETVVEIKKKDTKGIRFKVEFDNARYVNPLAKLDYDSITNRLELEFFDPYEDMLFGNPQARGCLMGKNEFIRKVLQQVD